MTSVSPSPVGLVELVEKLKLAQNGCWNIAAGAPEEHYIADYQEEASDAHGRIQEVVDSLSALASSGQVVFLDDAEMEHLRGVWRQRDELHGDCGEECPHFTIGEKLAAEVSVSAGGADG